MPRGLNVYDDAKIQGRLWCPCDPVVNLDAQAPGCVNIVAGGVDRWVDKSGNAYHADAFSTTHRPSYVTNGINGRPSILFSGSKCLITPYKPAWPAGSSHTFFSVMQPTDYVGYALWTGNTSGGVGTATQGMSLLLRANPVHTPDTLTGLEYVVGGESEFVSYDQLPTICGISYTLGVSAVRSYNGRQFGEAAGSNARDIGLYIGMRHPNNAHYQGYFCHILGFNYMMTDYEVARVVGYLAWHWGFQHRLAPGHLFANRPPMIGD